MHRCASGHAGQRDHDDVGALRHDPAMRAASRASAGLTALAVEYGLASQPTPSRFTAIIADPANLVALRDSVLDRDVRGLQALRGGHRLLRGHTKVHWTELMSHRGRPVERVLHRWWMNVSQAKS